MTEDIKRHYDSLATLWKGGWDQFNERRKYEWKVCIAIWTAYAAFVALVITGRITTIDDSVLVGTITCAALIIVLHAIWIHGLGQANRLDRKIAIHYERKMQDLVSHPFPAELESELRGPRDRMGRLTRNWSHQAQMGITLVLSIAAVFTVLSASTKPSTINKDLSGWHCDSLVVQHGCFERWSSGHSSSNDTRSFDKADTNCCGRNSCVRSMRHHQKKMRH